MLYLHKVLSSNIMIFFKLSSRLETLLNHFRSYGLNDLEFIIVNSKLSHAQERLHELKNRVSFEVLQETEEEEVWNLMQGGKDDMYVYDR